jgi:hypothetical protein
MSLSQRLGKTASSLQVAATFFDSRLCETVPFFGWFPKLIAGILFVISGLCWTLEMLTQEPPANTSRWQHVSTHFNSALSGLLHPSPGQKAMTLGSLAGICSTIAGAITITCLYVMGGPLFWVTSSLAIVGGLAWYKTDEPEKNDQSTASQQFNRLAAGAQIVSAVFFIAGLAFPPAAPILHAVALAFAFLSSTSWVASYFIKDKGEVMKVNTQSGSIKYIEPNNQTKSILNTANNNTYSNSPNNNPSSMTMSSI